MARQFVKFSGLALLVALAAGCGGGGPIEIPAGFSGVKTASGRFGGPQAATGFGPGCVGFISNAPDHQIQVAAPMPFARFVANGGTMDVTLVVQLPDGTYRCNDDAEGLNPIVDVPNLPAGLTKVWIGALANGGTGNYKFGFASAPTTTPASIGAPTQRSTRRRTRRRRRRRR